ncbi:pyrroline-5-carboxylate reductase [Alkalicoccus daliensis]|uniref:Pyrroline-5-carboxylate reductase n=1 Tax=Alkalicoccus daliensis TaxID=745820 RepID=A0A1H0B1F4_9BACI|nr:pyrroline-5-carboxylate reductase [Alkalicoccus daliensis]SDN39459.1 pyrroline-5-carboxylate reductase [Alkalicoccus daliensis]
MKITMIGAGSMAEALIAGWVKEGSLNPAEIFVTNREDNSRLNQLKDHYRVSISRDILELTDKTDIVILSCKPKDWESALKPLIPHLNEKTMIASVMAGVTITSIEELVPVSPVIRTMPNTSAAVLASMTSISYGAQVSSSQKAAVESLFSYIGETAVLEETMMDAVTALTGTGPAYIYYLMESMEKAAANIGVPAHIGRDLVAQTLIGASRRVQEEESTPAELYKQIMSPGGTTEAGFDVLKERQVQEAIIDCIGSAYERSQQLGKGKTSLKQR